MAVPFAPGRMDASQGRTMEQLADPGSILLTPDTLALAEGHIDVRSLGPMPVKGLAEPIEVYEMLGASTIRSRLQAAATSRRSFFGPLEAIRPTDETVEVRR